MAGPSTMTYLGAERVVPHYNVMGGQGSAGSHRRYLANDPVLRYSRECDFRRADQDIGCPRVSVSTKWSITIRVCPAAAQGEVGDTALFLVSSLGRGITGEVIYRRRI